MAFAEIRDKIAHREIQNKHSSAVQQMTPESDHNIKIFSWCEQPHEHPSKRGCGKTTSRPDLTLNLTAVTCWQCQSIFFQLSEECRFMDTKFTRCGETIVVVPM